MADTRTPRELETRAISERPKQWMPPEMGGLVLCKIPKEFMRQRAEYYQQQADTQMNSIDNNFMRENDPRMPLFKERSSKVSFGKGT